MRQEGDKRKKIAYYNRLLRQSRERETDEYSNAKAL